MEHVIIRRAESKNIRAVAEMFNCLWPRLALLNTHGNWFHCSPKTPLDVFPTSFSWPRNRTAVLLALSRLTYAHTRMVATLLTQSLTSKDGMLRLHTGEDESEQNLLRRPRTGLEIKVPQRWPPIPGWMPSTPSVLTKHLGSRSWIAVYIIERTCNLALLVPSRHW
jgi:hypothetical protein